MFSHIKAKLAHYEPTPRHVLVTTNNILGAIPNTLYEIKNLPNVFFLLSNSFLINGIQFVLPFVAYSAMKLLLQTQMQSSYPEYNNNKYVTFSASVLDNTAYLIIFTRFKLKNVVFNIVANLGATRVLHEEFSDDEPHPLCLNCKKEKNHLSKEISLMLHYFLGGLTITILETLISYSPYFSTLMAFMLTSYWKGFGILQYPLSRENICAEHKIAILMQDRTPLIVFGILYALIELRLIELANDAASDVISERVIATTITNILSLFSLIHAHNLTIAIPLNNQAFSGNIPFDPVTASWALSTKIIETGSKYILTIANKNQNSSMTSLDKVKLLFLDLSNRAAFYIPITFLIDLFIATELKSLKEFSRARALRPYMISFLEDVDSLLKTANDYNDHPVAQLVHFSLKIPIINKKITAWGAKIAKNKMGIEPVFTKALVNLIKLFNLNENLAEIQKKVEEIHKKSVASHNRNSWHKLLGFGSNTPSSWFIYNGDFVKLKTRAIKESSNYLTTTALLQQFSQESGERADRMSDPLKNENHELTNDYKTTPIQKRKSQSYSPKKFVPKKEIEEDYCMVEHSPSNSNKTVDSKRLNG